MEKYKFSVVINILENQDFLKKTIINIIKQTVNFKSDVQLILVGSIKSDLKRYLNKYPNNIKTLDMDCFDRNIILNSCQGKYIHFIKPNDIFSKNTFKEVYNFFEANCENIDMVSVPFFLCKEKRISNNKYTTLVSGNHIIDLKDEPQNFVTPSSNTFYKRSVICNLDLDSSLIYNASVDLNFKMYAINSKFGYVCSKGVKYFYTKQEKNITIDKEYADIYTILDKMVSKELEDYEKEYILYEIMRKLKNMTKDSFESLDFYDKIIQNFQNYLSFIDDDFIVNKTKIVKKL